MKKIVLLLSAALLAAGVSAQNNITVDNLNAFRSLQVNGNKIELTVTQNPELPLSMGIEMNGNDPNVLKWWETDGTLQIKYSPKNKEKPVVIKLNCHTLEELDLQGASMVMEGKWEQNMVTINLSGSAKLTAEIYAKDLKVNAQTSATAVIKGGGRYADYDTRSKSALDVRDYEAESAFLRAAGYSECYVYGSDRLVIEAFDGAAVFYRGTPEIMRLRGNRGGHINSIGE